MLEQLSTDFESGLKAYMEQERAGISLDFCYVHLIDKWRSKAGKLHDLLTEFDMGCYKAQQFWKAMLGIA